MKNISVLLCLLFSFVISPVFSQQITYSDKEANDMRTLNFEIIGKVGGNYLVYKEVRNDFFVYVYDKDMKLVDKVEMKFMPAKTLKADFIAYPDHAWMVYQYQKRNVIYCEAVKINGAGKLLTEPRELDTTSISFFADNKIYNTINSEDKKKIMIYKIQKKNDRFNFTTLLFDENLALQHTSRIETGYQDRKNIFSDFFLTNTGNFVFTVGDKSNARDFLQELSLITKAPAADEFAVQKIDLQGRYLDEVKLKIDNVNTNYLINTFYYEKKRGNVEGLFVAVYDEESNTLISDRFIKLAESTRDAAKESGSNKVAFNDYFIRDIILKKDGGYILTAEDYYTQSRNMPWNRYDYLYGSPYYSPYYYNYYSPYSFGYYGRRYSQYGSGVRYYYNNVLVLSVDSTGKVDWSKVLHKSQFDENNDNYLSYALMVTGGQLHFLFNELERRNQLINDQSITATGTLNRNPPLRSLDKGYEFMPRYAKQVSANEILVPCTYRNYFCIAKIEY